MIIMMMICRPKKKKELGKNMLPILPDKDRFYDDYSFGIRHGYRYHGYGISV
jgi:hypothetical protein